MVVAEVMAGITLVKASVDFIKSNINTAKDIGEIAGAIDGLFKGHDELQSERARKSGLGIKDQFGIKNIAHETIDAKLAAEKMQEMKNMIDMRFGPGTWQSIVDERAKRIQEAKEAERLARIQKRKEEAEFWEQVKMVSILSLVAIFMVGAFIWIFAAAV